MNDYDHILRLARASIHEIEPEDVSGTNALVVDIREPHELALGAIPDAVTIRMGELVDGIGEIAESPDGLIILYCAVGERSALAAAALEERGYTNVRSLAGGIKRWMAADLPTVSPAAMTTEQRHRYARHVVLPEVGIAGQERLLDAKVVIIGAGGLGSPAALYLAAAGIGTLGIVDDDIVELSNLQRQILHGTPDAGKAKTDSATASIQTINPDIEVVANSTRLAGDNALGLLAGYDVIIDGSDNFETRYLINDASLCLRIPVVHGSVFRFEGQIAVFSPYEGPCYRCIFPDPPPADLAPNCAQTGVFGVIPGVLGTMQATETLKLLLGIGEPLIGKLVTYDGLRQEIHTVRLKRDANCPSCGDESEPPRLGDEPSYS